MFSELLDHHWIVPLAAMSDAIYLPRDDKNLPQSVATFIRKELIWRDLGTAMRDFIGAGLGWDVATRERFGMSFE